ncbi:hypothetical protein AAMO2058_001491600 [Amorphochlora amoebiformis]
MLKKGKDELFHQFKRRINGGISVDARDEYGHTALIIAARADHIDMIRYLIHKKNADVNISDRFGYNALKWAAARDHVDVMRCLIKEGHARIQTKASIKGWNRDITHDYTCLMIAAREGNMDAVKYLLSERASMNTQRIRDGVTALMLAASHGETRIVRLLVKEKADPLKVDQLGSNAFIYACKGCHVETITYFIQECGSNVNMKVPHGTTPLGACIVCPKSNRCVNAIDLLITYGADINMENAGYTPLILAIEHGVHVDQIKFLVEECNANILQWTTSGKNSLQNTQSTVEVFDYLVSKVREDTSKSLMRDIMVFKMLYRDIHQAIGLNKNLSKLTDGPGISLGDSTRL